MPFQAPLEAKKEDVERRGISDGCRYRVGQNSRIDLALKALAVEPRVTEALIPLVQLIALSLAGGQKWLPGHSITTRKVSRALGLGNHD